MSFHIACEFPFVNWRVSQRGEPSLCRGAIAIDTTSRPKEECTPFVYVPKTELEQMEDDEALRIVQAYNPIWELVVMLLRRKGKIGACGRFRCALAVARNLIDQKNLSRMAITCLTLRRDSLEEVPLSRGLSPLLICLHQIDSVENASGILVYRLLHRDSQVNIKLSQ